MSTTTTPEDLSHGSKPREAHALAIRSTHETHDHRSRVNIGQRRAGIASATRYAPEPAPQVKALTSARGGLASRAPRATFPNELSRAYRGDAHAQVSRKFFDYYEQAGSTNKRSSPTTERELQASCSHVDKQRYNWSQLAESATRATPE